jgi:hypothetical protein
MHSMDNSVLRNSLVSSSIGSYEVKTNYLIRQVDAIQNFCSGEPPAHAHRQRIERVKGQEECSDRAEFKRLEV